MEIVKRQKMKYLIKKKKQEEKMSESILITRNVPIRYTVDVCVTGAGPGGIAAAVVAARQGAKVLLLDAHTMPGGMSTAGRVPVLMPCSDGVNFLPDGFGREVIERFTAVSNAYGFDNSGIFLNAEQLKRIYEDLLTGAGVELLYYSRLAAVNVENGTIRQTVYASQSGLFAVAAKVFIDGTGDGTVAAWAGAPFEMTPLDEIMPATLCSLWAGFDWQAYRAGGAFSHNDDKMPELLAAAFKDGSLSTEDHHHTGIFRNSNLAAGGNITHAFGVDGTDERSLTRGLVEGRRLLREYENFYRKNIPGFSDAEIVDSGSLLGVRESRRITGDYTLNNEDFKSRRDFADEIGRYNFPADIHPPRPTRAQVEEHKKLFRSTACGHGESYGIPYRIMLPCNVSNLLTCGRCVSTDRYVHASLRVIPGCWITGQAAGMAAAMAADSERTPREINVQQLRANLRKIGAFFH